MSKANTKPFKRQMGSCMAELPAVLLVLLIGLAFPILDFAVIGYRSLFLYQSARSAAETAGRARSLTVAKDLAKKSVERSIKAYHGVAADSVEVSVITALKTAPNSWSRKQGLLPKDEDTSAASYQIEVIVKGHVEPLARVALFNIAGVSKALPVTATGRSYVEVPNGLKY